MQKRMELPYLDELLNLYDLAKENGYDKDLDNFKYDLMNRPQVIPFPDKAGPDFAAGGLVGPLTQSQIVNHLNAGIGKFFKQRPRLT